jgi:hypothetical protein
MNIISKKEVDYRHKPLNIYGVVLGNLKNQIQAK